MYPYQRSPMGNPYILVGYLWLIVSKNPEVEHNFHTMGIMSRTLGVHPSLSHLGTNPRCPITESIGNISDTSGKEGSQVPSKQKLQKKKRNRLFSILVKLYTNIHGGFSMVMQHVQHKGFYSPPLGHPKTLSLLFGSSCLSWEPHRVWRRMDTSHDNAHVDKKWATIWD